jgi:hypothetical protein
LAAITFALIVAGCDRPDIQPNFLQALTGAEQFELLSIDPQKPKTPPADAFHGFPVLGRTPIDDPATRKRLIDALRAGAQDGNIPPATSFKPKHVIRVTSAGTTTDFIVSFATSQVQIFVDDLEKNGFLVSPSPQPTFDEVLRAKSVPLPAQ